MSGTLQHKRGTAEQHILGDGITSGYTGPEGEITVDTTYWTLRVHDGSLTGGHMLARADFSNVLSKYTATTSVTGASHTVEETDQLILADASSGNMSIYLPDLSNNININRDLYVKKIDSSGNNVIITAYNTQTIDGATSQAIQYQYTCLHIIGSELEWHIV